MKYIHSRLIPNNLHPHFLPSVLLPLSKHRISSLLPYSTHITTDFPLFPLTSVLLNNFPSVIGYIIIPSLYQILFNLSLGILIFCGYPFPIIGFLSSNYFWCSSPDYLYFIFQNLYKYIMSFNNYDFSAHGFHSSSNSSGLSLATSFSIP